MIKSIMLISFFGGPLDGYVSVLPFPDAHACGAAMLAVERMVIDAAPEVMLQCQPVVTRPMPRPEGLENE